MPTKQKAEARHAARPGEDQPGFAASNRTDQGDIDQIDAHGMGLPRVKAPVSAREGVSGVNVGRLTRNP